MHLLIDGRSGMRGVAFSPEAEMPEWHYAFATHRPWRDGTDP